VQENFAGAAGEEGHHHMSLDELLGYLRNPGDLDLTPFADLLSQTEEMGDPALPSPEHTAILRWIGEAMHQFEQRFPLEEPLASQVRRLKPLAAAIALTDPDFMQPDVHPLHQLLDTIHERAVGWQARLGRAGVVLEKQVATAVEGALSWFGNRTVDMEAVCADFIAAAERDQARAQRMSRRVVEAELGRVKTAAAKREASGMINGLLERYAAPPEIGEFLKGPWYDSAQLLLLKFGADSEQWQKMRETTETLLDSLQSLENAPEDRRQHIFALVTQLPKEMRRWLLSLHHDTDAVNDAMALVEFAHLRILRQQPVNLEWILPLTVAAANDENYRSELVKALGPIQEGHWFGVETRKEGMLRVKLVLKEEREQRLLFTNLAGMKVLDQSFEQFDELLEKKRVMALPTGSGFSLCLAIAAGISTTEKLNALYTRVSRESPGTSIAPVESTSDESAGESQPAPTEVAAPEPAPPEHPPEAEPAAGPDQQPEPIPEAELELDLNPDPDPDPDPESGPRREPGPELEHTPTGESADDPQDLDTAFAELQALLDEDPLSSEYGLDDLDSFNTPPEEREDEAPPAETTARDKAGEPTDSGDDPSQWLQPPEPSDPEPRRAEDSPKQPGSVDGMDEIFTEQVPETPDPKAAISERLTTEESASSPDSTDSESQSDLNLPMGAWLGFHDGATPLMAKLAVHDPEEDIYIFVNRSGIKMRQIAGKDLRSLVARGLVDILQTTSNFRDTVNDVRKKLDS